MSSGHMHLFILVSQQASVGLSGRPKTGILLSVWVPLHILPPFLLHVLVCVCMCIVCSASGEVTWPCMNQWSWIDAGIYYEALNNKKAINYDIDNPVGYRRSAPSVWFTDVPAVFQRSLITTFPGSEKRIYRTVFLIRQATPFLRILNDIALKW